eukprot:gb/GECG01015620.1/.p1 GENE.gb/GECG01015620.1/~~gb/GECG01015620.1/.p1  ORF type:complete len:109 (+),score=7.01 gb/GECG01015620.1/:1-327(+)
MGLTDMCSFYNRMNRIVDFKCTHKHEENIFALRNQTDCSAVFAHPSLLSVYATRVCPHPETQFYCSILYLRSEKLSFQSTNLQRLAAFLSSSLLSYLHSSFFSSSSLR